MNEMEKNSYIDNMQRCLPSLRAMLHFSQADLAEKVGVSRQQIVALETGKRKMTWNCFTALLFVFSENKETKALMAALGVYSQTLESFYKEGI